MRRTSTLFFILFIAAGQVFADTIFFSTGDPDGRMAMASRPGGGAGSGVNQETEAADDFILSAPMSITDATFAGLLPSGLDATNIAEVRVEIYRVFPNDSDTTRTSGPPVFSTSLVPTRVNSPSDVELADRDSASANLTFTTSILNSSFTVANSVDSDINPKPNNLTGGDGAVTGEEVIFSLLFSTPLNLPADHYFFVPQVLLSNPNDHFLWLSAPRPITSGTGPFTPDLQTWIRNADLSPDWLRVGTDIVGGTTFNGAFSLSASSVPEPSALLLMGAGLATLLAFVRQKRTN